MSEPIWYYALGDKDQGPVSEPQLKALLHSGEIKPSDLVWKEGMPDWIPATQVPDLIPKGDSPVAGPVPRTRPRRSPSFSFAEPLKHGRTIGQPLMLLGLVVVLLSKGCDTVGDRYVARLQAKHELAMSRYQDKFEQSRIYLEDKIQAIGDKDELSERDSERLIDMTDQLEELSEKKLKEEQELKRGDWREMKNAARDADANNKAWAYWRAGVFVLGTIVLSVGLLAVGFNGEGAERWICLMMLGIIMFSVYVGGAAWLSAFD